MRYINLPLQRNIPQRSSVVPIFYEWQMVRTAVPSHSNLALPVTYCTMAKWVYHQQSDIRKKIIVFFSPFLYSAQNTSVVLCLFSFHFCFPKINKILMLPHQKINGITTGLKVKIPWRFHSIGRTGKQACVRTTNRTQNGKQCDAVGSSISTVVCLQMMVQWYCKW